MDTRTMKYNRYLVVVQHEDKQHGQWQRAHMVKYTEPGRLRTLMKVTFNDPTAIAMTITRGSQVATYERIAKINGRPPKRWEQQWVRLMDTTLKIAM